MKPSDVKSGDVLIADGGFSCIVEGTRCTVASDDHGPYITCSNGRHYLDSQIDNKGELVGLIREAMPKRERAAFLLSLRDCTDDQLFDRWSDEYDKNREKASMIIEEMNNRAMEGAPICL